MNIEQRLTIGKAPTKRLLFSKHTSTQTSTNFNPYSKIFPYHSKNIYFSDHNRNREKNVNDILFIKKYFLKHLKTKQPQRLSVFYGYRVTSWCCPYECLKNENN